MIDRDFMFNAPLIPVLVLLGGHLLQAETKLDLFIGDEKVGYGTYKETTDHHGHRTTEFHIWSKPDSDTKVAVYQVKVIDAQGFPIREEERITQIDGKSRKDWVLTVKYDSSGAARVTEAKGKAKTTERIFMPIPGLSRADASDLWFSKTVPMPGTRVSSTVFDVENMVWRRVETTYIGKHWITVGGRQVEANEIRDVRDDYTRMVYLDDRGQPLLMKKGQNRTEKHF
jgi:hypothetical protein